MTLRTCKTSAPDLCSYIDAGMTLFPCSGFTKIPARKGFLEYSFDPEFVPEDRNYGVLLKNRHLVIDCDPRSYEKEDKPLTRLLNELELPSDIFKNTFTVRTPGQGYHIYFRKHQDVALVNSLKEFPGLEFKTKFIMACGSYIEFDKNKNPVRKGYSRVFGAPSSIIPAPQILLARLLRPERKELSLDSTILPDNSADVRNFIQHCTIVEPAIEGKNGDLRTYQVACLGRDLGLSEQKTLDIMVQHFNPRCQPVWLDVDLVSKVQNAYEYSTRTAAGIKSVQNQFPEVEEQEVQKVKIGYQLDARGGLKKSMFNLKMFFEYPTLKTDHDTKKIKTLSIPPIGNYLKYDQFAHRIVWSKPAPWYKVTPDWSDEDAIMFKSLLSEQLAIDFSTEAIHEVAAVCANKRAFHPVRDYLETCKWDGVFRLDNWLTQYCGALESEYSRFVGRKALIAAVARVYRPGCKFDHVLVTEGAQGIGKSYMWETLASPWFTDAPLHIHDKSAVEVMRGKWIVELAEMDTLSKYESQTIKGFLTRTEDRCRMAYERKAQSFPRQNIFVGSINPEQTGWLKDRTGNRRFWPLSVHNISLKELAKVKDSLWAEALLAFERGEKLYVSDPKMQQTMRMEVDNRMQEDPWFSLIEAYLYDHAADFVIGDKLAVMPVDLYQRCVGGSLTSFDLKAANRIASILKLLGFDKVKSVDKLGYMYTKLYNEEI